MGAAADRVKQKFSDQCSHGNSARKTNLSRCFFIIALYCCGKLAEIHHRQPLVLAAGTKMQWLGGTADQAANYCEIAPASWFNWYRVTPGQSVMVRNGAFGLLVWQCAASLRWIAVVAIQ